jgi:hypothetical protein
MRLLFLVLVIISNISTAGILDVKFSEIMYNPTNQGSTLSDDLEFIELKNTGSSSVNMNGVTIGGAVAYTFPVNTTLESGEFYVIASNSLGFSVRYPSVVANGQYIGKLKNSGERIVLNRV